MKILPCSVALSLVWSLLYTGYKIETDWIGSSTHFGDPMNQFFGGQAAIHSSWRNWFHLSQHVFHSWHMGFCYWSGRRSPCGNGINNVAALFHGDNEYHILPRHRCQLRLLQLHRQDFSAEYSARQHHPHSRTSIWYLNHIAGKSLRKTDTVASVEAGLDWKPSFTGWPLVRFGYFTMVRHQTIRKSINRHETQTHCRNPWQ